MSPSRNIPEQERVALLQDEENHRHSSHTDSPSGGRTSFENDSLYGNPRLVKKPESTLLQKFSRVFAVVVLASMSLAIVSLIYAGEKRIRWKYGKYEYCTEPACIHAASNLLQNMSPKKVDPCVNFEEFVCGGWQEAHDLRPDQSDMFEGTLMAERSQQILRHVLEGTYEDLHPADVSKKAIGKLNARDLVDMENFDKIKAAYKSCMDVKTIEERGIQPLAEIFATLEAAYDQNPNHLTDAISYLGELGISALVSFGVGPDDKDPDTVVVSASSPRRIGLPSKQYYHDKKIVPVYVKTIEQMFEKLKDTLKGDGVKRNATAIVEFETKLSDATLKPEDAHDITKTYHPFTLKDLMAMFSDQDSMDTVPSLDFQRIFKKLTPGFTPGRIIVGDVEYMKKLKGFLKETDKDTVRGYIEWKLIQAFTNELPENAAKPLKDLRNTLRGTTAEEERWKTCVRTVDGQLGWILGRFFIQKAFSEEAKKVGDRIIMDIKHQFIETLNSLDWVSFSVQELATQKVKNIIQKVGYPDKGMNISDPKALKEYYAPISIESDKFFENTVSVRKFEAKREWKKLGKPTDRTEWYMTPPTVNAYYSPPGNEIVFPAGIMQFPVFGDVLPEYLSYGAFGSVAGHELSHAFDSLGRHYDIHGNYSDWWDNSTVAAFEERAECFVHQFAEFSIEGPDGKPLHVNGRLTLGENIADAGGVNAAFAAWQKREKQHPNKHLPGLDKFTKEQLFFMSYGSWWCSKSRKEAAINRIRMDPHSPKFARILGTMANSPGFLESFQCPVKKPRCKLW